jgi:hypothetical protein
MIDNRWILRKALHGMKISDIAMATATSTLA